MTEKTKYRGFASKMRQDLYRQLKLLSAAEEKSLQTLLEEAVVEFLEKRRFKEIREPGGPYVAEMRVSYSTGQSSDDEEKSD